jgi:hypothetical protein
MRRIPRRLARVLLTTMTVVIASLGFVAGPAAAAVGPANLSLSLRGITSNGDSLVFQYVVSNFGPGDVPPNTSHADGRAYTLEIELPSGVLCNGQAFICLLPGAHASRVKNGTGWLHTFTLTGDAAPGSKIYLFVHPHPQMTDPNMGNNSRNFDVSEL